MADLSIQGALALDPPSPLSFGDILVRTDAEGRFCLNDLHRASGGEKRHGPSYWLANAQTRALIEEVVTTGIPAVASVEGAAGGTFVARELVIAYAAWISPAFHLKVIRYFLDGISTHREERAIQQDDAPCLMPTAKQFVFASGHTLRTASDPDGGGVMFNWNDICAILGYTSSPSVIRRYLLNEGDIKKFVIRTGVGHYPTNHVTRQGLLRALDRCCRPNTDAVKDWIVREVIPAIDGTRQTRPLAPQPTPERVASQIDLEVIKALEMACQAMTAMASVIKPMIR